MPYTSSQLTTFYTNANMGMTPSAAESLLITAYAQQNANGALTDAQTLTDVLSLSRDKTDVAVSTYEFFTGSTPTLAGLSYLVHGGGNANDLSSAYYANFNTENRYYNFAINLAFGGPNAASFASTYGNMTFDQAVSAAYELIVGSANATAAGIDPTKAIASIEASLPYFQLVASERASTANQDLATKAIMIGYILEEAIKADVGTYAKGIDGFMGSLATTGTATTGDLLTNYPAGGQTFNLTAGIDNIAGGAGNDTVNATDTTLSASDVVNGGGGNNVLSIVANTSTGSPPVANPVTLTTAATVSNFQTVDISATGLGTVTADVTKFAGTTQLNVNTIAGNTITAAATTNVTDTSNAAVTITGGDNVNVGAVGNVVVTKAAGNVSVGSGGAVTITGVTGTVTSTSVGGAIISGGSNVTSSNNGGATYIGFTDAGVTFGAMPTGSVTINDTNSALTVGANVTAEGATGTVTVTDAKMAANNVSIYGGTTVAVTETGVTTGAVTIGGANALPTGAVTVNVTGVDNAGANVTTGAVNITGGTVDTVTLGAANAANTTVTFGAVTVTGASTTTAVNVSEAAPVTAAAKVAGVANGAVTINDANAGSATKAGTITSVSLANVGNVAISDNALNSLSLAGSGGTISLTDSLTAPTVTTFGLGLSGYTGGTITDVNNEITTLNVTVNGASSTAIADTGATTLTVTGTGDLKLGAATALSANATAINASGLNGGLTITDNYTKAVVTGGSGNDVITLAANLTKAAGGSIALGSGNDTVLSGGGSIGAGVTVDGGTGTNTISASLVNAGNASGITNFQVVDVGGFGAGAGNGALDTTLMGGSVSGITMLSAETNGVATVLNLANNVTITDNATGAGSSVTMTHASGSGTLAIDLADATKATAQVLNVTSTGDTSATVTTDGVGTSNTLTLSETDNHLATVTALGATPLSLAVNTNTGATSATAVTAASALTTIDASGTTGGVTITAGASVTSNNVTTTYNGLTILGGTGGDTITNHAVGGVITEGATPATVGTPPVALHNVLTVDGTGATINDQNSAAADTIHLSGVGGSETANLGTGTGIAVSTVDFSAALGAVDTVHFGSGTATVTDSITYQVTASAVSASTSGNELALTGTLTGETLAFPTAVANAAGQLGTAANVGAAQTFDQAVFLADQASGVTAHTVVWFQYGGNTYLLDNGGNGNVDTTDDHVVKITGVVDLSHTTVDGSGHLVF